MKCYRKAKQRYLNQSPEYWMSYLDFIDISWRQTMNELRMGLNRNRSKWEWEWIEFVYSVQMYISLWPFRNVFRSGFTSHGVCQYVPFVIRTHFNLHILKWYTGDFIDRWLHIRCMYELWLHAWVSSFSHTFDLKIHFHKLLSIWFTIEIIRFRFHCHAHNELWNRRKMIFLDHRCSYLYLRRCDFSISAWI